MARLPEIVRFNPLADAGSDDLHEADGART